VRLETALPAWWQRFWFTPASPHALAVARIVFALHGLWLLWSRDFAGVAALPPDFFTAVSPQVVRRYGLLLGRPETEAWLQGVAAVALIAAAAGWAPRLTCLAAAILLYHLAPYESVLWAPTPYFRGLDVTVLGLVIVGVSRSAEAWVVGRTIAAPSPSWEYRWPVALLQLFVALTYFFSGYSKLWYEGLDWASAENIRNHLLAFTQDDFLVVYRSLGTWLADQPVLCALIGAGTLLLELTFPLAVFVPSTRRVYVPAALVFHGGVVFAMNVVWLNWPQLAVFVNWDWVRQRVAAVRGRRAAAAAAT
jgi:hypothetical protein